jgi:hypothetical protein
MSELTPNVPPTWTIRGKTIRHLVEELQTFEDQDLEVHISVDDGKTTRPISLVGKFKERCLLVFCPS